jgi:cytochrome c peroxidase
MHWLLVVLLGLALRPVPAWAGTPPNPLAGVPVPVTPGLLDGRDPIVVDRQAAIQLGKALFWDANVGSDGVACASCHFHAGADRRTRNQLNSGLRHHGAASAATFDATASGALGGPNYSLKAGDFPLHRFANSADRDSAVLFDTDDVVGSAGVFLGDFLAVSPSGDGKDQCAAVQDTLFHQGGLNTRQVTDRNAPTVINAAFNYRDFWDGRANNLFNGESAFGARDPQAGVWVAENGQTLKQRVLLPNAALASLAVAPPLNDVEMSCRRRTFPELGRKLLQRRPLESQAVHPQDSVLGEVRHPSGKGLKAVYADLAQKAFAERFWAGAGQFGTAADGTAYSQMEANFAFMFGLSVQLYLETLVSDQSLFDTPRDGANVPLAFNEQQKRGLTLFMRSQCAECHLGPTLSAAANPQVYVAPGVDYLPLLNRTGMFEEMDGVGVAMTLMDVGFLITSVAPSDYDVGLGGRDPYGNPLSFAEQYRAALADPTKPMVDPLPVVACNLSSPFTLDFATTELIDDPNGKGQCRGHQSLAKVPSPAASQAELALPWQGRLMVSVNGAFKVPSLRNVELTGPYMHNGGMKSLEEVIEFYNRGGNNVGNLQHSETLVFPHAFSEQDKADLLAFLKTLTDERVRWERAPFDHPALLVPHGHGGGASPLEPLDAADRLLEIPAVGKNGRTAGQGPLRSFESYLRG